MTIGEFATRIEMLRALYPISATSWFRTAYRNAKVGGVPNSYHRFGLAVDVQFDPDFGLMASNFFRDAKMLGLQAINEGDHWHIEPWTQPTAAPKA